MYKIFEFKKEDILQKDKNNKYKNEIYSVFNASKNPVVVRFNITLTNKLWKKWLHILQPIVKKCNISIHKTIGTTPALASTDPSLVNVEMNMIDAIEKPKFKVGNRIKIFKHKNKFEKGHTGYSTKEIFKVRRN